GLRLLPYSAERLYGKTVVTAASRLERFSECPFAYYVTYNLKARERKVYQVQPADLGVVFHEVLELFTKRMAAENIPWGSLTREELGARVDGCVEAAVPTEAALRGTARNQHILRKVKRICAASVWALCEHLKRGVFEPAAAELEFSGGNAGLPVTSLEIFLNEERKLVLTGRIDRVDIMRAADGAVYVKIIDYKSGNVKFDLAEVLSGVQLQLILYMKALLKNAKALFGRAGEENIWLETKPGGVFYFHIDDPILPAGAASLDPERKEEMLLKCFRMSGLALAETEAVTGMDGALAEGGESPVIPVSINRNGAFGKTSSVAAFEYFEQLGAAVEEKAKEIGRRMTEGVITPDPHVKGRRSACDFCRYGAVCGNYT
ncbi:MAG: PD-(D/E)XK nuclease family protein, partial [Clostridiales bacterium]|nr:PD-(D/E)XK nuclease family protein [Clostridiales bacterium]